MNNLAKSTLLSLAMLAIPLAQAEDIDIFLSGAGSGTAPNLLFMFDNSANWQSSMGDLAVDTDGDGTTDETWSNSSKMELEHVALYHVLTHPDFTDKVNVGMMGFAHGNSPKGGKILKAISLLNAVYQEEIKTILYENGTITRGEENLDKANNAPYALSLNEAYLYFGGKTPASGLQDGDHDPNALDGTNYLSPSEGNPCVSNFIVVLGNGSPDNGENNAAEATLSALGGIQAGDPISLPEDQYESSWSDEFARFLNSTDVVPEAIVQGEQNAIIYVIDVYNPDDPKKNTKPFKGARALLQSIATQGGGMYYAAANAQDIVDALTDILNQVIAVNSVFASTTLPVSVNVRGTNLNQVYMGVFRPDENWLPRWFGNLKQYQLAWDQNTDTLFLADARCDDSVLNSGDAPSTCPPAQNPATGFINFDAESFWSHDSTFWDFLPRGTPESGSDLPDGEVVEKGGAAQELREGYPTGRNVYTCTTGCTSGSSLSGTPFNTGNADITQADLGAVDATERNDLIDWVRGDNNHTSDASDADQTAGAPADVRPSIHGDVLHSRPAVINYNRDGSDDDVVVYYGANDGLFHAIKGGQGASDGHELWSFIPEEFFDKLKRLRDNNVSISDESNPYFFDGIIGIYQNDANNDGKLVHTDNDKVYIYLSARRGGRLIYALDVSNPSDPKLLWKKTNTDTGYSELGQTWSEPQVAKIKYDGGSGEMVKPVLIFGGGYDATTNDLEYWTWNNAAQWQDDTMGRAIFVVDAVDGDVLWQAGPSPSGADTNLTVADMVYSIPSDTTLVDSSGDGHADRIYVGDTGGNVWRVKFTSSDPSTWVVHKLADLGGFTTAARRFLYAPDVVYSDDGYYAVLIGSGDREHPFETTVVNHFYMLKDRDNTVDWPYTLSDLYDATDNDIQNGTDAEQAAAQSALDSAEGWYIELLEGEKVVSSAVTLSGNTFFNTNQPGAVDPTSCTSNLGTARAYAIRYEDASAMINQSTGAQADERASIVEGGGFLPSPVPVVVVIDGHTFEGVISGTNVFDPGGEEFDTRQRTFWYKEMD